MATAENVQGVHETKKFENHWLSASATGFFLPGIYLIVQLNSEMHERWRLCLLDHASADLLKACTIG